MRFKIQLPDNKSIKIRRMVLAYMRGAELPPVLDSDGSDVRVMWRALHTLRAPSASPVSVDVADCGAAYRFLMPILAATPGAWLLTGTPRLLQRPILPLVEVLRGIGAEIERVGDGWLIHGKPLSTSTLTIDASQSSQMASALVMAAPLLEFRTLHLATTDIPSLSYLRMTLALTRDCPVEVPGVNVPDISVGASGDWSAALFWFAHARLHPGNEYCLSPLSPESIQGDSVICQWFKQLNMSVACGETKSCITETPLVEIMSKPLETMPRLDLDVRDNLDTVPVMAALAALLPADISFRNVANLRHKEADRLQALAAQLAPFADIQLSNNALRVIGKGVEKEASPVFDTCRDHRLAMAFLLFPNAELNDVTCLSKSYPALQTQLRIVGR